MKIGLRPPSNLYKIKWNEGYGRPVRGGGGAVEGGSQTDFGVLSDERGTNKIYRAVFLSVQYCTENHKKRCRCDLQPFDMHPTK